MLAPQNETSDITDTLSGSLTTWYQNVDSALKSSECVPGYYEYAQAPSYGTQCPIQEGGSTKIDIHTARFNVISIDNSFIDVEFDVPITIPAVHDANWKTTDGELTTYNEYYVGFKSAFDLIDSYRIYSNGDLVYTQNHANFESFLNYVSLTDTAKENSACYATSSKIKKNSPNVPGTYITLSGDITEDINTTVHLAFKIPLNSFMILQNLKWFPGFMGDLTIEIYPTFRNLVWCMVDSMDTFKSKIIPDFTEYYKNGPIKSGSAATGVDTVNSYHDIYDSGCRFVQINEYCRNALGYDVAETQWQIAETKISANTSTLSKFQLYTAFYMLKMDVYNALEYNYLQVPLLFPVQTVSNVKFTQALGNQQQFTLQNTATLSHCDTIFIVFPMTTESRTCFTNPEITAQLNINGKFYPRQRYRTVNDPRFYNMELDSLNINNNPLVSVSEDVANSITPYQFTNYYDITKNTIFEARAPIMSISDLSNFFIGIPLSTDEDFMGGISSNGSTVQVELLGERASPNGEINDYYWTEAPEALFLEDKLLKIYAMKPAGRKQIDITNATLEQIAAGSL